MSNITDTMKMELIRNYYELVGDFTNIKNSRIYSLAEGMSEDDLYLCLGYKHEVLNPSEYYKLRKLLVKNDIEGVCSLLNCTEKNLEDRLKSLGIDKFISMNKLSLDEDDKEIIKAISAYLLSDNGLSYEGVNLYYYIDLIKKSSTMEEYKKISSLDAFKEMVNGLKLKSVKDSNYKKPVITYNTLLYKDKILKPQLNKYINDAIEYCVTGGELTISSRNKIIKYLIDTVDSLFVNNLKTYMLLLDIAHFYDLSLKELLIKCNYLVTDKIKVYDDYGVIISFLKIVNVEIENEDKKENEMIKIYRLVNKNCSNGEYFMVNDTGLKYLSRRKFLTSINKGSNGKGLFLDDNDLIPAGRIERLNLGNDYFIL